MSKKIISFFRTHTPLVIALGVFFLSVAAIAVTQSRGKGPVKVKIVRIVDGDTTTIEKTMDETSVKDFTKQFENIKGKNVQVMITVEDLSNDESREKRDPSFGGNKKNKSAQSMHFNFNMDSSTANAFAKAFVFSDSGMYKKFVWHDSSMKNFPKDFDFRFDFDDEGFMNDFNFDFDINTGKDGKTIILKNGKGKTIAISGDEDNASLNISEDERGKAKTKTKTIVVEDEKGKSKKKVIVSTSVIVMDLDDEKEDDVYKSGNKKSKDGQETNFSFYPNPSDGNFTIELGLKGKDDAQVKITDIKGKEVYNEKILAENHSFVAGNGKVSKTVDLFGKKGTFIVTITQGKKTTSKKIIIE